MRFVTGKRFFMCYSMLLFGIRNDDDLGRSARSTELNKQNMYAYLVKLMHLYAVYKLALFSKVAIEIGDYCSSI